ncbi:MAG: GNAT family N-acetyltransferase, partial [Butyricicoccaceae bacterium]
MDKSGVTVRLAERRDAQALREIYAPYVEGTAVTFEYEVPSVQEFADRIGHVLTKYPYLVAETDGRPVGYAYAGAFKERAAYGWAVEVSIYVRQDAKRQGIGARLYEVLERVLAAQNILNLNACIACPAGEADEYLTRDSVRFHRRMGYRLVGEFHACGYKFGRWYHMVWMEKQIGAHTANPPAVRPLAEVRDIIGEPYEIRQP